MIDPRNPDFDNTPASPDRPAFDYAPAEGAGVVQPAVTVITPFYNTGAVFHETARTVLGQSLQQWEWVIVNDGSTDPEALEVLEHYRRLDARIRVVDHPERRGLPAARNTGFAQACADYVAPLDSDDLLEPTAIEKWLWFLVSHPEYGFCNAHTVGFGEQRYLWGKGFEAGSAFLRGNQVAMMGMVRRAVHLSVGGYDESIVGGLEDWDFWLRCANAGYWGGTVPEYLEWYRRRRDHRDRWGTWDGAAAQAAFQDALRRKYPRLWAGGFPDVRPRPEAPNELVPDELPFPNRLRKEKPRLLMVVPWLVMGGADKFNLDLVQQLRMRGWEVTIAATLESDHPWLSAFARLTPDIFCLHHFLRLPDYPRFLRYLIQSRQVDAVLISNSELGYALLPYLRSRCPGVAFLDYCHMEEEYWKNGGYPRLSVDFHELLDLAVVSSQHLKRWMVERGAEGDRVEVCYINVDPDAWRPDPEIRARVRKELGLGVSRPVILHAARICGQKQPRVVAKTLRALRERGVDFAALVAGDGPDLPWLRAFVKRQSLTDCVRVLGAVPNERVRELMAAADVFFLPSQWEGISLAIYEAMASGLAVVASDVGGQRELVTPDCGMLLPRGDESQEVERYADALQLLMSKPDLRQALGRAARARVCSQFHLSAMGDRMQSLIWRARDLHERERRPSVGAGLGLACAARAIEQVRISRGLDGAWNAAQRVANGATVPKVSGRARLYAGFRRLVRPVYWWLVRRGHAWPARVRERLESRLW